MSGHFDWEALKQRRADRDNILSLIDGAIEDCDLSDDAMRWTPGPADDPPRVAMRHNVTRVEMNSRDITHLVNSIEFDPPMADPFAEAMWRDLTSGIQIAPQIVATTTQPADGPSLYDQMIRLYRSLVPPTPDRFIAHPSMRETIHAQFGETAADMDIVYSPNLPEDTIVAVNPALFDFRSTFTLDNTYATYRPDPNFYSYAAYDLAANATGIYIGGTRRAAERKRARIRRLHLAYRRRCRARLQKGRS